MGPKVALTNVRVFDGRQLQPPGTVVIDGARIGTDPAGAEVIDGDGGVLLPGLIDAHVHLTDRDTLGRLAVAGVTTALDMACGPPALVDSLRGVAGLTDIRSAGTPAIRPAACTPASPSSARAVLSQARTRPRASWPPGGGGLGLHQDRGRQPGRRSRPGHAGRARRGRPRARPATAWPTPRRTRPRRRRSGPGSACSPTCRWTGRWTRPRRRAPGPTTAS